MFFILPGTTQQSMTTITLYRATINHFSLHVIFLLIIPITWLPLYATIVNYAYTFIWLERWKQR